MVVPKLETEFGSMIITPTNAVGVRDLTRAMRFHALLGRDQISPSETYDLPHFARFKIHGEIGAVRPYDEK